jgi:hypothetical protein
VEKTEQALGRVVCRIRRKSAKKQRCKVELIVFEPVLYSAVQCD